jgi:hypothetical protein
MHSLNALLAELYRTFSSSVFLELEIEFLLCTLCTRSMPSWQSFYRTLSDSVFSVPFLCTVFTSKVFNNLEASS